MFAVVNERKPFGCGHDDFCFVFYFFLSFIHPLTLTSQSSAMPHYCLTSLMCNQTMPTCFLAIRYNKKSNPLAWKSTQLLAKLSYKLDSLNDFNWLCQYQCFALVLTKLRLKHYFDCTSINVCNVPLDW